MAKVTKAEFPPYPGDIQSKKFLRSKEKNQSFHNYPTRHSGEFHLPRLRTLSAQNTFFYEGPKFWNSLKDEIKDSPSLNSFKNKLKLFLLLHRDVTQTTSSKKLTLMFFAPLLRRNSLEEEAI